MLRTITRAITLLLLIAPAVNLHSQCVTAPPAPSACTGVEPLVTSSDIITVGFTKYYYGPPAGLNNITLRGGTLIICSDVTINNLNIDSGTLYIRPGAKLTVSNGTSLTLRGNASVYNYGTFELLNHLQLEPGWATAAKPSIVVNATPASVLKVPNNYLTINDPNSKFVNRGTADFYGIVTELNTSTNAICMDQHTTMNMLVLINKKKDAFTAPYGGACMRVQSYSQLLDTMTNDHNVNLCLGGSLTKDACGSCKPNGWGTPHVNNFCSDCATITLLNEQPRNQILAKPEKRNSIQATPNPFTNGIKITWSGNNKPTGIVIINTAGAVVYNSALHANSSGELVIPLPVSLPAGAYVVKVIYAGEVLLQKMIKQQL